MRASQKPPNTVFHGFCFTWKSLRPGPGRWTESSITKPDEAVISLTFPPLPTRPSSDLRFESCHPDLLPMFYVYVLRSRKTGRRYVGSCADIEDRLRRHNAGESKATKHGVPWVLLHVEEFATRSGAMDREQYYKTGRGRDQPNLPPFTYTPLFRSQVRILSPRSSPHVLRLRPAKQQDGPSICRIMCGHRGSPKTPQCGRVKSHQTRCSMGFASRGRVCDPVRGDGQRAVLQNRTRP